MYTACGFDLSRYLGLYGRELVHVRDGTTANGSVGNLGVSSTRSVSTGPGAAAVGRATKNDKTRCRVQVVMVQLAQKTVSGSSEESAVRENRADSKIVPPLPRLSLRVRQRSSVALANDRALAIVGHDPDHV